MTLLPPPRSIHSVAVSVLVAVMLLGCSMPDGPDPAQDVAGNISQSPSADPSETPQTVTSETPAIAEITLNGPGQILPLSAIAQIKDQVIDLEVAITQEQQALGLMFRSELPDNRGMLFPFSTPRRASFWMKDVPVPLDMVFLRDGKVVGIAAAVPPCQALPCPTYGPGNALVDQVLELRAGRAAELELQVGDEVIIRERAAT